MGPGAVTKRRRCIWMGRLGGLPRALRLTAARTHDHASGNQPRDALEKSQANRESMLISIPHGARARCMPVLPPSNTTLPDRIVPARLRSNSEAPLGLTVQPSSAVAA